MLNIQKSLTIEHFWESNHSHYFSLWFRLEIICYSRIRGGSWEIVFHNCRSIVLDLLGGGILENILMKNLTWRNKNNKTRRSQKLTPTKQKVTRSEVSK